ncbi:MAG: aromatic aminobenezylarsenical efflux permease ArsG family transporter [Pseudomonadota bacterium]
MTAIVLGGLTALWLGILMSISPCPMATNIVAISFIGKQFASTRKIFLSGLLYILGRVASYVAVGVVTVAGILSIPAVSNFLQNYMNKLLGPLLIVVGMFLLELIRIHIPGLGSGEKVKERAQRGGVWGAGLLGIVFALSFCPISAALFFGSLIPLSVKHGSMFSFPVLFGIGTGLPVLVFAGLIAFGARFVGKVFDRLTRVELWVRRITGGIIVVVGIYYCLKYIFGVNFTELDSF